MTKASSIFQAVSVADPNNPTHVIQPNADGSINISGSISAVSAATATAAAPSYSEGVSEPLSQDLSGNLRVTGTFNASTTAHATAAAPSYGEGTDDALSQNLTGDLRVTAKQSGTWTVGISAAQTIAVTNAGTFATQAAQSGTWNIGTVTTVTGVTAAFGAIGSAVPASGVYNGLIAKTANPSAASDGNLVGALADKVGRQVVSPYAARDLNFNTHTTITASTSETTIISAEASTFHDLLSLNLVNSGSTATLVDIRDDTGGTVRASFYVPATDMRGQTYTLPFPQTATNKNWTAQCGSSTSSLIITAQYVKNI